MSKELLWMEKGLRRAKRGLIMARILLLAVVIITIGSVVAAVVGIKSSLRRDGVEYHVRLIGDTIIVEKTPKDEEPTIASEFIETILIAVGLAFALSGPMIILPMTLDTVFNLELNYRLSKDRYEQRQNFEKWVAGWITFT